MLLTIFFSGDKFSAREFKAKTKLPLKINAEKGEIAKRGKYKGKPSPYSSAYLSIKDQPDLEKQMKKLKWMLIDIRKSKMDRLELGIVMEPGDKLFMNMELINNLYALPIEVSMEAENKW